MKLTLLSIIMIFSSACFADKAPIPGRTDERIKQVTYNSRDVVTVTANYGISSLIEFADYEKVETISLGDSLAWSVFDVKNRIFLKPVEDRADTNMLVVTKTLDGERVYNFALKANEAPIKISNSTDQLTFTVKFRYPEDELKAEQQKQKDSRPFVSEVVPRHTLRASDVNMEYTYRGDKDIAPRRVFDDGTFTYFQFNEAGSEPAIFASDVNSDEEAIVNYHKDQKSNYIVVQRLARKFVLRDGNLVTCVYNEHYPLDYKQQIHIAEDSIFGETPAPAPTDYSNADLKDEGQAGKPVKPKGRPIIVQAPIIRPLPDSKEPETFNQTPLPAPTKSITIPEKDKVEWYHYD